MILRKANKCDYAAIKNLYGSAFPKEERAPFWLVRKRAKQNRAAILVAENNGEFIGFLYTVEYKNSVYLFYFAVESGKRGGGNGSEILKLLKEYYKGKTIFLAREPLDDSAENNEQRVRRRNFYIKNGYIDLPYKILEKSVIYDLMSTDENFNPEDYDALIKNWAGKLLSLLVKMEILR